MRNKKIFCLFIILVLTLTACTGSAIQADAPSSTTQVNNASAEEAVTLNSSEPALSSTARTISVSYDANDLEASESSVEMTTISLTGNSIDVVGNGASVDGSTVTIFETGMYSISGILNDGQVLVDTADEELVTLVLNGASITSSTSAPIYILNAEKTILTLAEGTENFITDGDFLCIC